MNSVMDKLLNYKKEDLFLYNDKMSELNDFRYFSFESDFTLEQKVSVVDHFKNGFATYIIELIEKYQVDLEQGNIKKDFYGKPKTVSLKAWIHKNDIGEYGNGKGKYIVDEWFKYGKIRLGFYHYLSDGLLVRSSEYGYRQAYQGDHIVHLMFNNLLKELMSKEIKYFKSIDERSILLKDVKEFMGRFGWLNLGEDNKIMFNIYNGRYNKHVELRELIIINEAYKRIQDYITTVEGELISRL